MVINLNYGNSLVKKINKQTFKNIIADELHNKEYISTHQDRFIFITNIVNRYFSNISGNINILDFGSHTGVLGVIFQYYGYNIRSIDLDLVIEDNIQTYKQNDLKIDRLPQDWKKLPYEDDHFDLVIFSEVLEHLYESPIQILKELYRILKPEGALILTTPNVMKLENKIKYFFHINIYQDIERYCYNPRFSLHFREYTEKDLKVLLTQFLDFKNLKFYYFDYVGGRTLLRRIIQRFIYIISYILFKLRGSILVIAKK